MKRYRSPFRALSRRIRRARFSRARLDLVTYTKARMGNHMTLEDEASCDNDDDEVTDDE